MANTNKQTPTISKTALQKTLQNLQSKLIRQQEAVNVTQGYIALVEQEIAALN